MAPDKLEKTMNQVLDDLRRLDELEWGFDEALAWQELLEEPQDVVDELGYHPERDDS